MLSTERLTPELLFWRDVPVDVETGVFEYVVRNWGAKVTFISVRDSPQERAQLSWPEPQLDQVILARSPRPRAVASELAAKREAIHIFNGFRGETSRYLRNLRSDPHSQWGILAERPTEFGLTPAGRMKQFVSRWIYRGFSRRFNDQIAVFFALGCTGFAAYEQLGFRRETLFPFMYGPYDDVCPSAPSPVQADRIRLVYVGRLDRTNKGLDMLLETVRGLGRSDFTLDIVGGYGDMLMAVQEAAAEDARLQFLGPWEPGKVVQRMSQYDLCVIPSRYDGWNVITNQAINAGLGCIVSDGAASDELVAASGAGIVIPKGDQGALNLAIESVLNSREKISEFKRAALEYRPRIAPDSVGQYMIDVLRFAFALDDEGMSRPRCPWLEGERCGES